MALPSPFAPQRVTSRATEPGVTFWASRVSGKRISSAPTSPALAAFRNLRRAFKGEIIDGDSTGLSESEKGENKNSKAQRRFWNSCACAISCGLIHQLTRRIPRSALLRRTLLSAFQQQSPRYDSTELRKAIPYVMGDMGYCPARLNSLEPKLVCLTFFSDLLFMRCAPTRYSAKQAD